MNSEQHEVQLGDYVELLTGFPFKSAAYVDAADAVRLLRGDNIGQGRLRWEDAKRWPLDKCSDLDGFKLREGDVVLAMDRPWIPAGLKFAKVRRDDIPAFLVQRVARLRPRAGIATNFLHYVIASSAFTQHIQNVTTGTAVPHISAKQIREYRFELPDLSTQEACGDVLMALDDRIALLRETNATLEVIAQALFKSWFVDFDPVRAKQQGLAPAGMDEATAALFPDSFEESVFGLIPRQWQAGVVSDFAKQHRGSINPAHSPHTLFEHFSLPAFDNGRIPVLEAGTEIKSNKTSVPSDAVLLSKLNPHIPRVWLPVDVGRHAVCSTEFLVFVPTGDASREFVYCMFAAAPFQERLCQLVTGTSNSHQRVKPDGVSSLSAAVPTPGVLRAFGDLVRPLFEQIGYGRIRAQTLATLRDTLLPRLISGQLRLPEAHAAIEEAA